jgi:hypothetical protein
VERLFATRSTWVMVCLETWEDCDRKVLLVRRASAMLLRRVAVGVMNDGWRVVWSWEEMKA